MKKKLFLVCAALMCTVALMAQNISVVSSGGSTKLYRTLQAAIEGADPNSVIYLPGGGFTIADSVMITKRINIIGIGHKTNNDNVDGSTIINGNLWFNSGSNGSSIMGCYITGNIIIGEDGASVNDVYVKYCNLNSVEVRNERISGTYINQNYIRSICDFSFSSCTINNNVIGAIKNVRDGYINYNILCNSTGGRDNDRSLCEIYSSQIYYNVLKGRGLSGNYYGFWDPFSGNNCATGSNLVVGDHYGKNFGDNPIVISAQGSECFVNVSNGYSWWTISPNSDYHFNDEYKDYEHQIGIYAGSGFNDDQLVPIPYIVAKKIDEQTDASGKLNIKIRVKAGE